MKKQAVWKSSLILTMARLIASFAAMVLMWLIARRSMEDLGVFRTVFVFFLICDFIPLLGLQVWLFREISLNPQNTQKYLFHSFLFGMFLCLIGCIALVLISTFGGYSAEVKQGLMILTASLPAAAIYVCGIAALVGLSMGGTYGMVQAVETLVRTLICVVLIFLDVPILWLVVVFVAVRWATVVALWNIVRSSAKFTAEWKFSKTFFFELLRQVPVFGSIAGLAMLLRFAAALIIPWVLTDVEAGQFGAAYMFVDILLLVPTAFVTAMVPKLSLKAEESHLALKEFAEGGMKLILLVILPAVAGLSLLSSDISELVYGTTGSQNEVGRILQCLIWITLLLSIDQLLSSVMVAAKHQILDLWSLIVAAIVMLVSIPVGLKMSGVMGATWGVLLSILVLVLTRLVLCLRVIPPIRLLSLAWRPVLAAMMMAVVCLSLAELHWLLKVAAGGLVYSIGLFVLGAFSSKQRDEYLEILTTQKG